MCPQLLRQRASDIRIVVPVCERCAKILPHRAAIFRHGVQYSAAGGPVNVERRKSLADQITIAARALGRELRTHGFQDSHDPRARRRRGFLAVTVFLPQKCEERLVRTILRQRCERSGDHGMPLIPDEPVFTHEFVGETEHADPLFGIGRDQGRFGREPLGQIKLVVPQRARTFVIPDHHRRTRLRRPFHQFALSTRHPDLCV